MSMIIIGVVLTTVRRMIMVWCSASASTL